MLTERVKEFAKAALEAEKQRLLDNLGVTVNLTECDWPEYTAVKKQLSKFHWLRRLLQRKRYKALLATKKRLLQAYMLDKTIERLQAECSQS